MIPNKIQNYQMRKEAYYLPNLNSLHMQNREYLKHRMKVQQSQSNYQIESEGRSQQKNSIKTLQSQITKLTNMEILQQKRVPEKRTKKVATFQQEEPCLYEPSPFQRRKQSQQQRQNLRMGMAMQLSNPTINFHSNKREQSYSAIKQRISRYTKSGGKVVYKFKKSLMQIEKRKRNEEFWSQRENSIKDKAKGRLQFLMQESEKLKNIGEISGNEHNDIFYSNGESIRLNQTSTIKLKPPTNVKRSYTPQELLIHRQFADNEQLQAKTELYKSDSLLTRYQEELQRLKQKNQLTNISLKQKTNRINRQIVFGGLHPSRNINPQSLNLTCLHKSKGRSQSLSEIQIIAITPINK